MSTFLLNLGFWTRASFHTTTIYEILEDYVAGEFGKVYLADGSMLDIVGMGNVLIRVHIDSV
jgi:hypothetical protein